MGSLEHWRKMSPAFVHMTSPPLHRSVDADGRLAQAGANASEITMRMMKAVDCAIAISKIELCKVDSLATTRTTLHQLTVERHGQNCLLLEGGKMLCCV